MLCDDLEGWDREDEREAQEGGDMGTCVCIWLIRFVAQQNKHSIVKQYSSKDLLKKKKKKENDLGTVKIIYRNCWNSLHK